jgi:hypothetical protein
MPQCGAVSWRRRKHQSSGAQGTKGYPPTQLFASTSGNTHTISRLSYETPEFAHQMHTTRLTTPTDCSTRDAEKNLGPDDRMSCYTSFTVTFLYLKNKINDVVCFLIYVTEKCMCFHKSASTH